MNTRTSYQLQYEKLVSNQKLNAEIGILYVRGPLLWIKAKITVPNQYQTNKLSMLKMKETIKKELRNYFFFPVAH